MLKKELVYSCLMIVVVSVLVVFSINSYTEKQKALVFTPERLYAQTFSDPVRFVTDLQGFSGATLGFDSWIRFKSPATMHLRNEQDFKPSMEEVGRRMFADKIEQNGAPPDVALHDSADSYKYFVRNKSEVGHMSNEYVLINKKTHDYFYRICGM